VSTILNHFKPKTYFTWPPALTSRHSVLCQHSINVFCADLSTNSDYFPIQR
jgi:hypothetical protein